jgi:hypothetical protein
LVVDEEPAAVAEETPVLEDAEAVVEKPKKEKKD